MQWLSNRYARLALLTIGIALLIYLVLWIVLTLLNLHTFPQFLRITLAVLGAGLLVYKFFEQRIF